MQAAFFKLADIIPYAQAEEYMKQAVVKSYGKKGQKVVEANWAAIDGAIAGLHQVKVPAAWKTTKEGAPLPEPTESKYYEDLSVLSSNKKVTACLYRHLTKRA